MSKIFLASCLFLTGIIMVLATGCAPAGKNTYMQKRKQSSKVTASQLGKNRYYFSSGYQKKLMKNYKKR